MKKTYLALLLSFLFCYNLKAQRGKDGSLTVSSTIEVNEYTTLTADASAGNTSITVANSALNSNNRFGKSLAPGDLVMIIQMQGATILGAPTDSTWGAITNYNNCGEYELREVLSVPNATTINFTCPLINNYTSAGRVQVVRVPRYLSLTVNKGGVINCDSWTGQTGGVLAIEVLGTTTINGSIDGSGSGFRGGQLVNMSCCFGTIPFATFTQEAAQKGESIAGYQSDYNTYGGMYGRGAPGNGGGGGDGWNAGGGGGGNGGNISGYNSNGNPDVSNPAWGAAWNLEYPGFATNVSSGGGRGGYTYGVCGPNPYTTPPGSAAWVADNRRNVGGKGGRPLDYSTGRLFVGGGGGAGHEDNNSGAGGASGGGLVYLVTYSSITGTGKIQSNGANGAVAAQDYLGDPEDGPGGGGGGGTVIVNATKTISVDSLIANGGRGGSQSVGNNPLNECEGGGGGGSGGYIAVSNAGITKSISGGANGTTNASGMTAFPSDGGTKGGPGDTGVVTNFIIIARNDTICSNNSATLTATLSGTVPAGTTINWYDSITGGNLLLSGATYTTPVLTQTTVFYVSTCPGTYRQPDTVFINGFNPGISSNDTICKGDSTVLTASGGNIYLWNTSQTTNNIKVSPSTSTTYDVAVAGECGKAIESVTVNVSVPVKPVIAGALSRCLGWSDTLIASGDNSYVWENGAFGNQYITGGIYADSTITVIGFNAHGCPDTSSFKITLHPSPNVTMSDTNTCYNSPVTIHALVSGKGPFSYSWMPGGATDSSIVVPDTGQTVTVTVSNGCSTVQQVALVPVIPVFSACCDKIILLGDDTIMTARGFKSSKMKSYSWWPSVTCLDPSCDSVSASPKVTTTYTVVGTDSLGCQTERILTIYVEDVCFNFSVPNVFTPSEAGLLGLNNVFYIKTENMDSWSISIYDRWGIEMFNSTNPTQYWNGNTKGGGEAPAGVYYYLIKGICQNNTYNKDGFVQLIR